MATVTPNQPTSQFEILRRKNGILNASAQYTSAYLQSNGAAAVAGTITTQRGIGMGALSDNQLQVAGPNNFIGFVTRNVQIGGLQLADRVFGVTNPLPVGLESPFTDGLEVSCERGEEIEAEGIGVYLFSGTNAITTNTAVGTGLTFQNGQLRVAQANETAFYNLTVNNLTPVNAGALRIRAISTSA